MKWKIPNPVRTTRLTEPASGQKFEIQDFRGSQHLAARPTGLWCDFCCAEATKLWCWQARGFGVQVRPGLRQVCDRAYWGACENCEPLVRRRDFDALLIRVSRIDPQTALVCRLLHPVVFQCFEDGGPVPPAMSGRFDDEFSRRQISGEVAVPGKDGRGASSKCSAPGECNCINVERRGPTQGCAIALVHGSAPGEVSMPTATQTAKTRTMTKRDVIEYLGKSKRTVETYIAGGRLAVAYINGPNGKQATFDRADVERFKREMDEPMARAVAVQQHESNGTAHPSSMAVAPVARPDALQQILASLLQGYPMQRPKPWLTLQEAVEFSGLPASYLVQMAENGSGTIRAIDVGRREGGRWRFHRASLAK